MTSLCFSAHWVGIKRNFYLAFEAPAFRSCDVIWVPRQIAQALPTARQGPGHLQSWSHCSHLTREACALCLCRAVLWLPPGLSSSLVFCSLRMGCPVSFFDIYPGRCPLSFLDLCPGLTLTSFIIASGIASVPFFSFWIPIMHVVPL